LYQYIKYLSEHPEAAPNGMTKQRTQAYREQNFQFNNQEGQRNISWIPKIEDTIKKGSTLIAMGCNLL